MKKRFTVVVERSPESNWLVAEVVELPGCHTEAPDWATLEIKMREAVSVCLKTAEAGEPMPDLVGAWRVEAGV